MDDRAVAERIIEKAYQHGTGEITLPEAQVAALSHALTTAKPELADVWLTLLKIMPGVSATQEEETITRNVLMRYVSERVRTQTTDRDTTTLRIVGD